MRFSSSDKLSGCLIYCRGTSHLHSCFLFRRALMISLISLAMRLTKYCRVVLAAGMILSAARQELLPDASKDSAAHRWLNKKDLASRVLDGLKSPAPWTALSTCAPEGVAAPHGPKITRRKRLA